MAIRYSLEFAPEPRNDGSGAVNHDIKAKENSTGEWLDVPGYHKTIVVPGDEIAAVMAMPDGTSQEKQAKNTAYKSLLVESRNYFPAYLPAPDTSDWSKEGIEQYIIDYAAWLAEFTAINGAAATAASDADEYITVTLGLEYPVGFGL